MPQSLKERQEDSDGTVSHAGGRTLGQGPQKSFWNHRLFGVTGTEEGQE